MGKLNLNHARLVYQVIFISAFQEKNNYAFLELREEPLPFVAGADMEILKRGGGGGGGVSDMNLNLRQQVQYRID